MKFSHKFEKITDSGSRVNYRCDDTISQIDFVSDSCVRVAVYKDRQTLLPTFSIDPDNADYVSGRERLSVDGFNLFEPERTGEDYVLSHGVTLSIDQNNFLLTFKKDGNVIFEDRKPLAYNIDGEFGDKLYHYISRERGEKIYGLGDKSGKLNKAGNSYRIDTADSMGFDAEKTDPLYKHIPFYICKNSVGTYGIFYDTSCVSAVDLGREINNYYEPFKFFETEDNCIVYYAFFGSALSVLRQFASLCGKQAFPPKWSFDYCASTMAYTDAENSEEQMYGFLDKLNETGLNCTGFYLSSGYTSIGNQRCVFNWNYDKFPNPKRFADRFNERGIHLIPNIKPAFLNTHPMYNKLAEKGYFVKNKDGSPFVTQFWDGIGSYIDFTNKDAFDFWNSQVKEKLLDYGIPATWNDNNEFDIRDDEAVAVGFGDGEVRAKDIRSVLTYLMVKSSYTAQTKEHPDERPFLSTRSGGIGVRRMAQTWSGDNYTSFNDLKYCHNIGLTLSLSGLYFYGHDLGGFSGDMPSEELLLRWIQHGLFEPRFTIHSWNEDGSVTMPWSYPDAIPAVKKIFAQRKQLVPYYYSIAYEAVTEELPFNAPLFLYYDDENIPDECTSFMVGRDILATCVTDEGTDKVAAYLPNGDDWYLDGKLYHGGQSVELSIPAHGPVPYFVRSGCVFPTDESEYGFGTEPQLTFTVYPKENGTFESKFFDDDGKGYGYTHDDCVLLTFSVQCDNDTVTVSVRNDGKTAIIPHLVLPQWDSRKLVIE